MADIIRIVLPAEADKKTPVAASSDSGGSASSENGSGDAALTAKDVVHAAKKVMAYTGIKQIADSVISYELSTVSLQTGATEYQQKLQFAYSEGRQLASSVGALAMGGIMGGAAGFAVAAVGVGISYMMKFIGWAQNANTIQIKENREDISIQMETIRAGSLGRRNGS